MDPRDLPETWPYRSAGRSVRVGPHSWWVVDTGPATALCLLLLHGLGASGHSFRNLMPLLAAHWRLIVPDLPGQGASQTGARHRIALAPLAADLGQLCTALQIQPGAVVGHSAGAPGFVWCAGQGGAGFQTAPALSRVAESAALGLP